MSVVISTEYSSALKQVQDSICCGNLLQILPSRRRRKQRGRKLLPTKMMLDLIFSSSTFYSLEIKRMIGSFLKRIGVTVSLNDPQWGRGSKNSIRMIKNLQIHLLILSRYGKT